MGPHGCLLPGGGGFSGGGSSSQQLSSVVEVEDAGPAKAGLETDIDAGVEAFGKQVVSAEPWSPPTPVERYEPPADLKKAQDEEAAEYVAAAAAHRLMRPRNGNIVDAEVVAVAAAPMNLGDGWFIASRYTLSVTKTYRGQADIAYAVHLVGTLEASFPVGPWPRASESLHNPALRTGDRALLGLQGVSLDGKSERIVTAHFLHQRPEGELFASGQVFNNVVGHLEGQP